MAKTDIANGKILNVYASFSKVIQFSNRLRIDLIYVKYKRGIGLT
jgi:hypothetical protein